MEHLKDGQAQSEVDKMNKKILVGVGVAIAVFSLLLAMPMSNVTKAQPTGTGDPIIYFQDNFSNAVVQWDTKWKSSNQTWYSITPDHKLQLDTDADYPVWTDLNASFIINKSFGIEDMYFEFDINKTTKVGYIYTTIFESSEVFTGNEHAWVIGVSIEGGATDTYVVVKWYNSTYEMNVQLLFYADTPNEWYHIQLVNLGATKWKVTATKTDGSSSTHTVIDTRPVNTTATIMWTPYCSSPRKANPVINTNMHTMGLLDNVMIYTPLPTDYPTIVSVKPIGSEVGLKEKIVITFSKAMDEVATKNAVSISPSLVGTWAWNTGSTVLTFTPTTNMTYDTNYTVTISKDAKSQDGYNLQNEYSWTFKTIRSIWYTKWLFGLNYLEWIVIGVVAVVVIYLLYRVLRPTPRGK